MALLFENGGQPDPAYLATGYHGIGGPLTVEKPRYTSEIKGPITESALQLGYQIVDSSGARQTGFDDFQSTARDSQRCSTAKAYLVPAENRTNLDMGWQRFCQKKRILSKSLKQTTKE
ncbi:Glucose dehydrogenase like protein [Argiope bruennichi]|uniref:Glucose dehydrogenase like protein n=1 Tax=Argiope bruennichi TaxID=94029 RepID=A0A8T0EZ10_ARGBR|nr:Glucose dehydrogenase like protein [Argiope bruennichi]